MLNERRTMTRKQILIALISLRFAAAGNSIIFRWLLPKRMKRWQLDPMNRVTFASCIEAHAFIPPMKWPWNEASIEVSGGTYISFPLLYGESV